MEYRLNPSEDGQYVQIEVVGDATRAEMLEITRAAFALGAKLGIQSYLNDVTRARNVQPVVENVRFTKDDAPQVIAPDADVYTAVVVDPSDHSHDFSIAFLKSQGVNIDLFWDREEALTQVREAATRLGRTDPQERDDAG